MATDEVELLPVAHGDGMGDVPVFLLRSRDFALGMSRIHQLSNREAALKDMSGR